MQNFEGNSALVNHFCYFFPDKDFPEVERFKKCKPRWQDGESGELGLQSMQGAGRRIRHPINCRHGQRSRIGREIGRFFFTWVQQRFWRLGQESRVGQVFTAVNSSTSKTWTTITNMESPRRDFASVTFLSRILAIGGFDGRIISDVAQH